MHRTCPHPAKHRKSEVKKASNLFKMKGQTTCQQHCMLPHDLFDTIYSRNFEMFCTLFVGGPGELESYWIRNSDLTDEHPEYVGLFDKYILPVRLYGDGADSKRNQNFELTLGRCRGFAGSNRLRMSLLPCLAAGSSTLDTRLVLSVRSTMATEPSASHVINEVIAWSLECLRS